MSNTNIFDLLLIYPTINILLGFYKLFLTIKFPFAFGFSIVGLTVFIRLLLHPFFHKQTHMTKKMEALKPHLDALSHKHKDDKKKLQEEQLKLYKEHGINPASGCLYALLQMPIIIALYNVLSMFLTNGNIATIATKVNKIVYFDFLKITGTIDPWFFGFNLGVTPAQWSKFGWWYLLIPFVTGALQYLQAASISRKKENQTAVVKKDDKKDGKKNDSEDMQKVMSTQMKIMFPLMIGWFSYSLPVGLSLYWNIFSIFTLIQQKNFKKG